MAEKWGHYTTYSADDEMPDCGRCDHFDDNFDCSESCGAEHGWYGYRRTEDNRTPKERGGNGDG